ncbi:hypothetical protein SAMN02746041_00193 [Desulfacinum hydrothermale DSM 13146]|uniref:Phage-Barnase-EndoU-ColicinE5/D-RelE like nuclease 2 domain-containing protein n=1 Tax=Desulfacinum hydrothermale DSM 13146 TaxID=1121390 RepID=A0A1W1WZ87_9BACT|nr:hypothetical protein [Desulfacinum hydrothermale]SMC16923.1 hypothetical protein SAMN02746041_00193 [Desulfacinum hydrothermale DSM 13146]
MDTVISVDGVPIRLTEERWFHIVENLDDMAGHYDDVLETVADPDLVLPGYRGSLIAVRNYGRKRYLFAIYRQVSCDDGFVITAYFDSKINRKRAIWKKT